jgi:hypothetical protein
MEDATITRWLIALLVALAIVLLVGYARHDAGVDGRAPDPEDVHVVVVEAP